MSSGTRMESVKEIREAAKARRTPTIQEKGLATETVAFRPISRPPMALLCILDDGRQQGEWVRIRSDEFIIGRTEGDLIISDDAMMSGRHASITRHPDKGRYRWLLKDLASTNGTYVRVGGTVLQHGQEIMIGTCRFRFDAAPQGAASLSAGAETGHEDAKGTRGWQSLSPSDLFPSLVELTPQGEARKILVTKPDNWIGRDARQCSVVLPDDRMVSPRHAHLYRDTKGRWHLENAGSRNGTWLRVNRMPITNTGQFQLGEQRFLVRIL